MTYKCKIDNRWLWSLESAGIGVTSPSGRTAWIRKLDADLPTDEQWKLIADKLIPALNGSVIELTRDEMQCIADVAKLTGKVITPKKVDRAVPVTKAKPHNSLPQTAPSFAKRQFDRVARMHANFQSIIGGCCPSCNQYKLNVKNHGSWVGYYCKSCGAGGSVTRRDNNKRRR